MAVVKSLVSTFVPPDVNEIADATATVVDQLETLEKESIKSHQNLCELDENFEKDIIMFMTFMRNYMYDDPALSATIYRLGRDRCTTNRDIADEVDEAEEDCFFGSYNKDRSILAADKEIERFNKMRDTRRELRRDIVCQTKKKEYLQRQMTEITTSTSRKFMQEVIPLILATPMMMKIKCSMCSSIGVPIMLQFSSASTTHNTRHTSDSPSLCAVCARSITRMPNPEFPYYEDIPYIVNMQLIHEVDAYLVTENSEFKRHFGLYLSLIKCSYCKSAFNSLSDLDKHMQSVHYIIQ